jgi:hypothetical protein
MRQHAPVALLVAFLALLLGAPAPAAQPAGTAREPMVDGTAPFIQVHGGRLTVRAEDVALREIVQEIARQGAIGLFLGTPLEERVSADFADLPIDAAVRRLLRGYDCVVIADGHSASNVTVSQIWIFRKAHHDDAEAFVRQAAALLSDTDWRVRHDAVVMLGQARSDHAIGPLSAALRDADPRVREAAVEALAELDKKQVSDVLTTALTDDDESVRARAAELLAR